MAPPRLPVRVTKRFFLFSFILLLVVVIAFVYYTPNGFLTKVGPIARRQELEDYFFNKAVPFLNSSGVTWSTSGGTTLGFIRNDCILPWDDDVDIIVKEESVPGLENLANAEDSYFEMVKSTGVPQLYRLRRKGTKWPFVDIFVLEETMHEDGRYYFFYDQYVDGQNWPPITHTTKNGTTVPVPNNTHVYLTRTYGDTWRSEAKLQCYDHETEQRIPNCDENRMFSPDRAVGKVWLRDKIVAFLS